ncbi:PLDc N-terminal domain-containing protein [Candidatus Peregrinibacteria bacterium]|nr:PLDc N-terminal domain-containing protein [Candidatus Peregrinibacteria bacterium]
MTSFLTLLADDPTLRFIQIGLLCIGIFIVFLLLFATRDILLRTRSFLYQIVCILLVALLPGVGFLIYLLIRPERTLKQRETDVRVKKMMELLDHVFAIDDGETNETKETEETKESEEDEEGEENEEIEAEEVVLEDDEEILPK